MSELNYDELLLNEDNSNNNNKHDKDKNINEYAKSITSMDFKRKIVFKTIRQIERQFNEEYAN